MFSGDWCKKILTLDDDWAYGKQKNKRICAVLSFYVSPLTPLVPHRLATL